MDKLNFEMPTTNESPAKSNIKDNVSCLVCLDRLFVYPTYKGMIDYSRVVPCPACYHSRKRMQDEHRATGLSGVPLPRHTNTFSTFRENDANSAPYRACMMLVSGKTDFNMLLIYGTYGCGKSHLAYASCHEAIRNNLTARYYPVVGLMTELRMLMDNGNADKLINQLNKVDFLSLDDWGANRDTNLSNEVFEQIVDFRYSNEKLLLVTTNKDITEINPAVLSRFRDAKSRIVLNKDIDRRGKFG